MRTIVAPDVESEHSDSEQWPTLDRQAADTTRQAPEAHSDPTKGRKIGSDPYDDPTQGRKIGSDPVANRTELASALTTMRQSRS